MDVTYRFSGFSADPVRRLLFGPDGELIPVSPRVFDTLLYLIEHRGELLEKQALLDAIWPHVVVEEHNLNKAISILRRVFGETRDEHRFIVTEPGRGYRFVAAVQTVPLISDAGGACQAEHVATTSSMVAPVAGANGPARRYVSALVAVIAAIAIFVAVYFANQQEGELAAMPTESTRTEAQSVATPALTAVGERRLLTDFPGNHSEPTLSPDGTWMAFMSDSSGVNQIWIQSLSSGASLQITHGDTPAFNPSWSPVDDQILFHRVYAQDPMSSRDGERSIWSIDRLGQTTPRQVIELGCCVSHSWDGKRIVYVRYGEIWLANADGTDQHRVEGVQRLAQPRIWPPFVRPALSPDGRTIAYSAYTVASLESGARRLSWALLTIPSAGGEARPMTNVSAAGGLAWAPDGQSVVFSDFWKLWRIPVSGGGTERLGTGVVTPSGGLTISRDGHRLLYGVRRPRSSIVRTDPESGTHEVVHDSQDRIVAFEVSPDGRRIAFSVELESGTHVRTIRSDGSDLRQLTFGIGENNSHLDWSADGESLYVYGDSGPIRRQPLPGGASIEVSDDRFADHPGMSILAVRERPQGDAVAFVLMAKDGDPVTSAMIRSSTTGQEIALPPAYDVRWSHNGEYIVGYLKGVFVCRFTGHSCDNVQSSDSREFGLPRWSSDDSRILFRRWANTGNELWAADRDGLNLRKLITPRRSIIDAYDVTPDDHVIWTRSEAADEIWIAPLPAR